MRALVFATALMTAIPAAATVPLAGGVAFEAYAGVGPNQTANLDTYGWIDVPELASIGIDAFAAFAPASAFAFAGGDATWASADAGAMTFDHGWTFKKDDPFTYDAYAEVSSGTEPTWFYSFTAESDGAFLINWAVKALQQPVGFQGWQLFWDGGNLVIPGGDVAGSTSFGLLAGNTYTVALRNYAAVTMANGVIDLNGHQRSDFTWSISARPAVPEPATWAMLVIGFGLVGSAARRHPRQRENASTH
jgi:PEP-CTERM motif